MSNGKSGTQLVLSTGFSSQCFPVRSLTKFKGQDDDGMWKCRSYSLLALKLVYNLLKIFVFSCLCKRKCSSVCCEVDFFSNDILCLQEIFSNACCCYFFFLRIVGGAWLVAYRAEQRRRFKAVICAGDPNASSKSLIKTFKREESQTTEEDLKPRKLDGFYLVNGWKRRSLHPFYDCNTTLNTRIL